MTQEELIKLYHKNAVYGPRFLCDAEYQVKALFEIIVTKLAEGEEVSLPGIGKLKPVRVKAHQCLHPRTRRPMTIPAHRGLKLVMFKAMKKALNGE